MTPSVANIQLRYMPQLDGLRALAVALVVVHHLLQPVWFGGWVGIDLFFVLSGYLITSLLMVEIRETGTIHLRVFYLRRMLRLYPPLIVAVVTLFPLALVLGRSVSSYAGSGAVALTYTGDVISAVTGKLAGGPWAQTWTLALEEQFYLVWPAVLLFLVKAKARRGVIVVGLCVLAAVSVGAGAVLYRFGSAQDFNPVFHVGPLLIGCALALTSWWRWVARIGAVGAAGLWALAFGVFLASFPTVAGYGEAVTILGSAALVAHLAAARPYSGGFAAAPMVSVGKVSYEVYLWHFPLIALLGHVTGDPLLTAALVIPATLAASYLSHRFVSQPLNARFKGALASFKTRPEQRHCRMCGAPIDDPDGVFCSTECSTGYREATA